MTLSQLWRRIDRRIVILVVVLLVAAIAVNAFRSPTKMKTVTAHFPRAVSVFKGTDVRILGVNVGDVTAVIPEGDSVRVEMEYDASYDVPADAKAVIVTPTLVADRFVQLTPVYTGGKTMADGADIPLPDTGVPVELDRIYDSLKQLTLALGPNGVNKDGSLDNLLSATRHALQGQGARGNEMIQELSRAAATFGEGAGPLFDAVKHLAEFTDTLAKNDSVVRAFMKDLTGVSGMLADESDELQRAVAAVARAVGSVKDFVGDHRDALVSDIEQLTTVMRTIVSEKDNLNKALTIAPLAMDDLHLGFDHVSDSQNSRVGIGGNIWSLDTVICGFVQQNQRMPQRLKDIACDVIRQLLEPVLKHLGFLPPEYASYLPSQFHDTRRGYPIPQAPPVTYQTPSDPDVDSMLGGVT